MTALLLCVVLGQCPCDRSPMVAAAPIPTFVGAPPAGGTAAPSTRYYYCGYTESASKTFVTARLVRGGQVTYASVPVINNILPMITVQRDLSGGVVSMTCDYSRRAPYSGGTPTYDYDPSVPPACSAGQTAPPSLPGPLPAGQSGRTEQPRLPPASTGGEEKEKLPGPKP